MPEQLWHLRNCDLFSQLDPESIQRLERSSRSRSFTAGAAISLPNEALQYVFVVIKGVVKMTHITSDGRESILGFISSGEIFGELSVVGEKSGDEYVLAVEPTTIIMIPAEELRAVISTNLDVALRLTKMVGMRRVRIERRLRNLLFVSNRQRLIHLLLDLAEQFGVQQGEGILLKLKLSHQDVANLIGSTRESVTILLNQLRAEGSLETGRQKIILRRPERLAQSVGRRVTLDPQRLPSTMRQFAMV